MISYRRTAATLVAGLTAVAGLATALPAGAAPTPTGPTITAVPGPTFPTPSSSDIPELAHHADAFAWPVVERNIAIDHLATEDRTIGAVLADSRPTLIAPRSPFAVASTPTDAQLVPGGSFANVTGTADGDTNTVATATGATSTAVVVGGADGLRARVLGAAGAPLGPLTTTPIAPTGRYDRVDVTPVGGTAGYLVAWTDPTDDTVRLRRVDGGGNPWVGITITSAHATDVAVVWHDGWQAGVLAWTTDEPTPRVELRRFTLPGGIAVDDASATHLLLMTEEPVAGVDLAVTGDLVMVAADRFVEYEYDSSDRAGLLLGGLEADLGLAYRVRMSTSNTRYPALAVHPDGVMVAAHDDCVGAALVRLDDADIPEDHSRIPLLGCTSTHVDVVPTVDGALFSATYDIDGDAVSQVIRFGEAPKSIPGQVAPTTLITVPPTAATGSIDEAEIVTPAVPWTTTTPLRVPGGDADAPSQTVPLHTAPSQTVPLHTAPFQTVPYRPVATPTARFTQR